MAGTLRNRLGEIDDEKDRWFRERGEQVARLKQDIEHAGRETWNAATRAGVDLLARTPQQLQALGARVLETRKRAAAGAGKSGGPPAIGVQSTPRPRTDTAAKPTPRQATPRDVVQGLREAGLQADTAVRGAANVLTFGGADYLAAGLDALIEPGAFGERRERYGADLAQEKARNRYDATRRPVALATGQLGGTALGLGVIGPMEGALAAAPRLPGAATLTGREATVLLGAGAGTGMGMQAASDIAAGGRRSSWGDNLGAAVGGSAGTASLPLGPARAGAIGALVTSVAQDAFNGQPISLQRAGESALAGNLIGGLAGIGGMRASNALPPRAKGRLGETLGEIRSAANGQRREWTPKSRDQISEGGYWYPDARSGSTRFEDKFGIGAKLTPNQIRAQVALGPNFQLYHFTPADIGKLVGAPAAATAPHLINEQRRR